MRTRSWDAQPGQNCGIGKRSTRARGLAQNPPPPPPSGALPPSPAESSRPGSAHKKPPLTTSSRRGSLATPKKPVTQRSPPAAARRQASEVRRSDDEEIVAEIVVKTKSAQDSGDMDDEASDVLSSPLSSLLSDLDTPEPAELPVLAPSRQSSPQATSAEQSREATPSVAKTPSELGTNDNAIARSTMASDVSVSESLDDMSVLSSTPDDPSSPNPQPVPPSPAPFNGNQPDAASIVREALVPGQESTEPKSDVTTPAVTAANDASGARDIIIEDERLKRENNTALETTHPSDVEKGLGDPRIRAGSSPDPGSATKEAPGHEEEDAAESAHEATLLPASQPYGSQSLPDEAISNQAPATDCSPPLTNAGPKRVGSPSVQMAAFPSRSAEIYDDPNETTIPAGLNSVDPHHVLEQLNPVNSDSTQQTSLPQTSDSLGTSLATPLTQPASSVPVKIEPTQHAPQEAQQPGSETIKPTEIQSSGNVPSVVVPAERSAVESPGSLSRADADDASESELSEAASTDPRLEDAIPSEPTPSKSAISHLIGESRHSFASSASALTERSGLSSKPPSVSSKATTPLDAGSPREPSSHFFGSTTQIRPTHRIQFNVRPKVSVPTDLTPQEYAIECIEAAENSRLNPYALHQEEYHMLRTHISHAQVTTYLNIRNGILRLWVRNPQIAVTREEAIGCAKDTRWFDVANVCFDWLVRRGFINYGCVEIRQQRSNASSAQLRRQRTIVVIGAGFSGLGCARQLTGLSQQYAKRFREMGEEPPRVVVLEGRSRVGGRVYSRAFQTLPDTAPGIFRGKRFTAEMGGMIITGFDRGNPLNILVRGQLGLPYHCLRSDMSLYDTNGTAVDPVRDQLVEQLFNACLDRVSEYKFKTSPAKLIEGNRDLLDEGKDSSAEGHKTIALVEETTAAQPHAPPVSEQNVAPQVNLVPVSTDRMTGKVHVQPGTPGSTKAAVKAKSLGWSLKAGVSETKDIQLEAAANDSKATLGSVVDEALMQHKDILDLNAQDFRLLNWHIANLEYSNATNLNKLSIKGWDIDAGNEWEGKHTMVVGGYQSVARGLLMLPAPINIQHQAAVKRITYAPEGSTGPVGITLEDGQTIDADYVVNTIPLGVLKHGHIEFQPTLPSWKTDAVERLGFGVLNKVILVYKEAFWDKERDIFGMLQTPTNRLSLNQKDYVSRRGRFFQWFNVTNTTGMPCLLALMAGDAGYDTEVTPNDELIAEATEVLRMRYGARVTQPLEAIVTRWESDRFARGSYSNAGVNMTADDYNLMAKPLGNLYFAGEHTTVTHPATVHGAYLSGLRAAAEIFDAMLGPIEVPTPLVLPRETSASLKRKAQEEMRDPAQARLEAYEMEIAEHIHAKLGPYPPKPAKAAGSPYVLFNKVHYEAGRKRCEEGRRAGKGKPSPNEVRTMTSKMWKESAPEVRRPFEEQAEEQKRVFAQALKDWTEAAAAWECEAMALRAQYTKEHPTPPTTAEELAAAAGGRRAAKRVASYAEDGSDVEMG